LFQAESERSALEREIGRVEGMISSAEQVVKKYISVDIGYIKNQLDNLNRILEDALAQKNYQDIYGKLKEFAGHFSKILEEVRANRVPVQEQTESPDINRNDWQSKQKSLLEQLEKYDQKIGSLKEEMRNINTTYHKEKEKVFELKNVKREKEMTVSNIREKLDSLNREIDNWNREIDILNKEKEILSEKGRFSIISDKEELPPLEDDEARRITRALIDEAGLGVHLVPEFQDKKTPKEDKDENV